MALIDNRRGSPIIAAVMAFGGFMPTTKTFSLYLAKATITTLEDLLT
jgi:hypothetical protein